MNRFMCLGCGRYWSFDSRPDSCPYCADVMFTDNILDGVPPLISPMDVKLSCSHVIRTDIAGELKFCCRCNEATDITKAEITNATYPLPKLKDRQLEILRSIGL